MCWFAAHHQDLREEVRNILKRKAAANRFVRRLTVWMIGASSFQSSSLQICTCSKGWSE